MHDMQSKPTTRELELRAWEDSMLFTTILHNEQEKEKWTKFVLAMIVATLALAAIVVSS